jgi:hypothetical protein
MDKHTFYGEIDSLEAKNEIPRYRAEKIKIEFKNFRKKVKKVVEKLDKRRE